jgi:hypothetical protein
MIEYGVFLLKSGLTFVSIIKPDSRRYTPVFDSGAAGDEGGSDDHSPI